jgi:lipid-A-disaccharide synthase-like uncharacterized protein
MNFPLIIALTWVGQERRLFGLDWSYLVIRRDPVGILAYLPNTIVYLRNLMLIRKRKLAFTAATSSQEPRETN